ncbi:predicted protein [Botrytis cinerea T4]|uniref:Uncharacterized protein n=1 Tax=Botryotinia fuckeliana (strain T4) TaxID=999810 RepID=G2XWI1_BOTF4|nr:predicted protein [Botrytis cinerea T4]
MDGTFRQSDNDTIHAPKQDIPMTIEVPREEWVLTWNSKLFNGYLRLRIPNQTSNSISFCGTANTSYKRENFSTRFSDVYAFASVFGVLDIRVEVEHCDDSRRRNRHGH